MIALLPFTFDVSVVIVLLSPPAPPPPPVTVIPLFLKESGYAEEVDDDADDNEADKPEA